MIGKPDQVFITIINKNQLVKLGLNRKIISKINELEIKSNKKLKKLIGEKRWKSIYTQ